MTLWSFLIRIRLQRKYEGRSADATTIVGGIRMQHGMS